MSSDDRLIPMTAENFYRLRHRIATVADQLRVAANGGPVATADYEEWWLDLTMAMSLLEGAWDNRRPHLQVVK